MTVELVQGVEGQGPFIWPEEPKDIKPNEKMQIAQQKYLGTQRKREQPDEKYKLDPEDAKSLKERATLLLQGKVQWMPSWEEHGGAAAVAMGREGRDGTGGERGEEVFDGRGKREEEERG